MIDQKTLLPSSPEAIFVGVAGRIGSGKTTAAQYLAAKHGFRYIRYSQVLRDWLSPNESLKLRLQEIGWQVMHGGMQLELNSRLIARLEGSHSAAIDGLRHEIDYRSLSMAFAPKFYLIFLCSSESARYDRLRSRFADLASFRAADGQPVESSIDNLKAFAVKSVLNEGPLEDLYRQLDSLLEQRLEGLI